MISRGLFAVIGLCVLCAVAAQAWASPKVSDLRLGRQGAETLRLVVESDQPLDPHISLISNPYRVVIDLPAVEWLIGEGEGQGLSFVEKYRYGLFAANQSRLVLDLGKPALVKKEFTLRPVGSFGYRLVIDLEPANKQAFQAAARANKPLAPPERPTEVVEVPAHHQRKPLIVLDPGHGGNDPGTRSANGLYEKNIALAAAKQLKQALEATGKFRALLTRDTDIYIPHRQRFAVARANGADLFISLHADHIKNTRHRGSTIYTLSERASDREAAALAAKENKSDIIAGIDLGGESKEVTGILIELAQREAMNHSAQFANLYVQTMDPRRLIPRNPHRFASLLVLKAPDVPSVLVEMGYLSNAEDTKLLSTSAGRRALVQALVGAAERYFQSRAPQQY